ncbi:hypothetical protein NDU88_006274 [Pleurodeles waltl]|uniref:Uncharacterized protein n=1 Tax=Pleurodeles waltl TaxID=8319 RepID=A0AAV7TF51_PLEWA|nr:hypothetical protein NDU88_006274 [Pleurodeles waltl]
MDMYDAERTSTENNTELASNDSSAHKQKVVWTMSTLFRSIPPSPWGTSDDVVPDPDILWSETNQEQLPGDGRQRKALRAVTTGEKSREELSSIEAEEIREELSGVSAEEKREDVSGVQVEESSEELGGVQAEESREELGAVWQRRAGK